MLCGLLDDVGARARRKFRENDVAAATSLTRCYTRVTKHRNGYLQSMTIYLLSAVALGEGVEPRDASV
jgi:hypothetical protein